jgi:CheY-like chemotaxis protein
MMAAQEPESRHDPAEPSNFGGPIVPRVAAEELVWEVQHLPRKSVKLDHFTRIERKTAGSLCSPSDPVPEIPVMAQPLRILVADDDAEMIRYYRRMIPHLGHVLLDAVGNGLELVQSCRGLRPDLVISDVRMPVLDGVSAMESVQREECIPFLFVTADDQTDHLPRLKHGYVLNYLQKPVGQSELSSALEAASCYFSLASSAGVAVP